MPAEPRHKGVGLLAIIKGLKAKPSASASVPRQLAHYLSDNILPTAWYPERDYNVLLEHLARSVDPKSVGGCVWTYFGKVAAQRDIAGEQRNVPPESRTENPGIYRRFGDGNPEDVPGLLTRVVTLWSLYHDSGQLAVVRHGVEPGATALRLTGFSFPIKGMLDLQTAFVVEYARLVGAKIKGSVKRSSFTGDPFTEWHYQRVLAVPAESEAQDGSRARASLPSAAASDVPTNRTR